MMTNSNIKPGSLLRVYNNVFITLNKVANHNSTKKTDIHKKYVSIFSSLQEKTKTISNGDILFVQSISNDMKYCYVLFEEQTWVVQTTSLAVGTEVIS